MSETLTQTMEPDYDTKRIVIVEPVGKVSVLEALAENLTLFQSMLRSDRRKLVTEQTHKTTS